MNKTNNRIKYMFYSLLITTFIILIVFAIKGIFPFGKGIICFADLCVNIVDYVNYLNALKSFDLTRMFYSSNIIGGTCILGTSYTFFFGIFNLLFLLCTNTDKLMYFVSFIFVLKCSLAAFTMHYSLNKIFKENDTNELLKIIISVSWALSGFTLLNYTIIGWLDIIVAFPLFVIGYKSILENKGKVLYIITLVFLFFTSIELTVMVLIAVVFFTLFALKWYIDKDSKKQVIVKLGIATLIGIAISSVVLLPVGRIIMNSSRLNNSEFLYIENPFLIKLIHIVFSSIIVYGTIRNIKYYKRDNKVSLLLTSILIIGIIPICIEEVNKMWHGGGYRCFPLRTSFIIIYLMMICTYYYFINYFIKEQSLLDRIKSKKRKAIIVGIAIVLLIISFVLEALFVYDICVIEIGIMYDGIMLKGGLLIIISIILRCLFYFILLNKMNNKKGIVFIVLILLIEMMLLNYAFIGISLSDEIVDDFETNIVIKDKLNSIIDVKKNSYIKVGEDSVPNDGLLLDIPIYNCYLLINSNVANSYKKLLYNYQDFSGLVGNKGTILSDYLMNIKYLLTSDILDKYQYTHVDEIIYNIDLYKYNYNIANAFKYDSSKDISLLPEPNISDTTNYLYKNVFNGKGNITENYTPVLNFEKIKEKVDEEEFELYKYDYKIKINGLKVLYYELPYDENFYKIGFTENGEYVNTALSGSGSLVNLGVFKNETITLNILKTDELNQDSLKIYLFDLDKFNELTEKNEIIDCTVEKNVYTYKTTSKGNESLLIPLYYDDNWVVTNNGEKVDYKKVLDGLISVDLKEGENNIRLEFTCPLLYIGGVISLIGIGCLILVNRFSIIFDNKIIQNIAYVLFYIVSIGFLVYINIGGIVMQFLEL